MISQIRENSCFHFHHLRGNCAITLLFLPPDLDCLLFLEKRYTTKKNFIKNESELFIFYHLPAERIISLRLVQNQPEFNTDSTSARTIPRRLWRNKNIVKGKKKPKPPAPRNILTAAINLLNVVMIDAIDEQPFSLLDPRILPPDSRPKKNSPPINSWGKQKLPPQFEEQRPPITSAISDPNIRGEETPRFYCFEMRSTYINHANFFIRIKPTGKIYGLW